MKICEFCKADHDGSFGSGRFCNIKCSTAFVRSRMTDDRRAAVNALCSKKFTKYEWLSKKCLSCNIIFETKSPKQIGCSRRCAAKLGFANLSLEENNPGLYH